ncbi:hypothetical protein [Acinetobacter junii]|uniref:hypothetical protein n=1 Tax=Acinetobacter junii TaxID=40215 RepID=UPI00124F877A|nr:hypothetical protein [Acinetobacter junii]
MLITKYGGFDGNTWEDLCQIIFKRKYANEQYQKMPASPGDFGLEGYTTTGKAFQCYCPSTHYEKNELFTKQRDKITKDLSKLKDYEKQLKERLGDTKLSAWIFVTPEIDKNELLKHARKKEEEVKKWGLSIINDDFKVLLYDADDFAIEIREYQQVMGEPIFFNDISPLSPVEDKKETYEKNIDRKNRIRLNNIDDQDIFNKRLSRLNTITTQSFLTCDPYLKKIENTSPNLYMKILRLVGEFEHTVIEQSTTWYGTAEGLIEKLKSLLVERIIKDLHPSFDSTTADEIARRMIARWIAICELDYD